MVSIEEVFKDKQNHKYIKSERDEKRVCGRAIYFVSFLTKKTIFLQQHKSVGTSHHLSRFGKSPPSSPTMQQQERPREKNSKVSG
jgi:hypothetical protein